MGKLGVRRSVYRLIGDRSCTGVALAGCSTASASMNSSKAEEPLLITLVLRPRSIVRSLERSRSRSSSSGEGTLPLSSAKVPAGIIAASSQLFQRLK